MRYLGNICEILFYYQLTKETKLFSIYPSFSCLRLNQFHFEYNFDKNPQFVEVSLMNCQIGVSHSSLMLIAVYQSSRTWMCTVDCILRKWWGMWRMQALYLHDKNHGSLEIVSLGGTYFFKLQLTFELYCLVCWKVNFLNEHQLTF